MSKDCIENSYTGGEYAGAQYAIEYMQEEIAGMIEDAKREFSQTANPRAYIAPDEVLIDSHTVSKRIFRTPNTDGIYYYVEKDRKNIITRSYYMDLYHAMEEFVRCKAELDYGDNDRFHSFRRTVFGVCIDQHDYDVVYALAKCSNCLASDCLEFTSLQENEQFKKDFQTIYDLIGFDQVEVYREKTPEELRSETRQTFMFELREYGVTDTSECEKRFDTLYKEGKLTRFMPTGINRLASAYFWLKDWDIPFQLREEPAELAYAVADYYISIQQACEGGHDYSILRKDYSLIDGGVYDDPNMSIRQALNEVLADLRQQGKISEDDLLIPVDCEDLMEMHELKEQEPKSIFSIYMYGEKRFYENTSGLDVDALCKAYGKCENPFVEMRQYGKPLNEVEFAAMQQSNRLAFSVEFDADNNKIIISSDGEHFDHIDMKAYGLAVALDAFMFDYDLYEYNNSEDMISSIAVSVRDGKIQPIWDFLNRIVSEIDNEANLPKCFVEIINTAKDLMDQLSQYQKQLNEKKDRLQHDL